MSYKRVDLEDSAISYIREVLSEVQKKTSWLRVKTVASILGKLLLSQVDFTNGSAETFLPEGFSQERALSFREGWRPEIAGNTKLENFLKMVILEQLTSTSNSLVLIEDPVATLFRKMISGDANLWYLEKHVFHFLSSRSGKDERKIDLVLTQCNFPNMWGLLTVAPGGVGVPLEGAEIDFEFLDVLVQNCTGLFVEAYDGQSWIIWRKKN